MVARFSITVVTVFLFVLVAVIPVSAYSQPALAANGSQIDLGATIFIGEEGLNLTHALNSATSGGLNSLTGDGIPGNLTIGWWASAAEITTSAPTKTINLAGRYTNFQVAPSDFVGYTGNWYLLMSDGTTAQTGEIGTPVAVFNCQDPTLEVAVWDFVQDREVTGKFLPQGRHLGIQIRTNMYAATYPDRNNTVYNVTMPAAMAAHDSAVMPDGTTSIVNLNSPTTAAQPGNNGSWVETSYTGQLSPDVWRITNLSYGTTGFMTTYGRIYGTYRTMYWNNTNVAGTGDYSSKNYTAANTGIPVQNCNGSLECSRSEHYPADTHSRQRRVHRPQGQGQCRSYYQRPVHRGNHRSKHCSINCNTAYRAVCQQPAILVRISQQLLGHRRC